MDSFQKFCSKMTFLEQSFNYEMLTLAAMALMYSTYILDILQCSAVIDSRRDCNSVHFLVGNTFTFFPIASSVKVISTYPCSFCISGPFRTTTGSHPQGHLLQPLRCTPFGNIFCRSSMRADWIVFLVGIHNRQGTSACQRFQVPCSQVN